MINAVLLVLATSGSNREDKKIETLLIIYGLWGQRLPNNTQAKRLTATRFYSGISDGP